MHDHIFALLMECDDGEWTVFAMCDTGRDVWEVLDTSSLPADRMKLERWCLTKSLEEMGEW